MDRLDPLSKEVVESAYGSEITADEIAQIVVEQSQVLALRKQLIDLRAEQQQLLKQLKDVQLPKPSPAEQLERDNARLRDLLAGVVVTLDVDPTGLPLSPPNSP